jgi:hypothetical protein
MKAMSFASPRHNLVFKDNVKCAAPAKQVIQLNCQSSPSVSEKVLQDQSPRSSLIFSYAFTVVSG